MSLTRTGCAVFAALAFGVVSLSAPLGAGAAPSPLDPTFGSGGTVISTNAGGSPTDLLVQPDGKLVLLATGVGSRSIVLQRYTPSGAPDTTYGNRGRAEVSFSDGLHRASDAALQADGKIVVVGTTDVATGGDAMAVARFTTTGALDPGFGAGGRVTARVPAEQQPGASNPANVVVVQPDGRILIGGRTKACTKVRCPSSSVLVRFLANGAFDASFGTGGAVSVPGSEITGLAVDPTGGITATSGAAATHFSPTGAAQPGVTSSAFVTGSSRGFATAPTAFQPDGRYLVERAVSRDVNGYRNDIDTQTVRYLASGATDATFTNPPFGFGDEPGRATDRAQGLLRRSNGQIIVAGYRDNATVGVVGPALAVARLTTTGALDPTFANGGRFTTTLTAGARASVAAEQPDGKVVVAGMAFIEGSLDINLVLLRFNAS